MWSRIFAFWKDYEDRKEQIWDGLGKYAEACVEAAVPPLVLAGLFAMVALHVPNYTMPCIVIGLAAFAYCVWWLPYCVGKARNQLPKILGREPTAALGDARFGDRKDISELGYDGKSLGIYVGRWPDE